MVADNAFKVDDLPSWEHLRDVPWEQRRAMAIDLIESGRRAERAHALVDARRVMRTPRLVLRPPVRADLNALQTVTGHPEVMRQYVDLADHSTGWSRDRTAAFIVGSETSWRDNGFGYWVVELDDVVIGMSGLQTLTWLPEIMPAVEFGFRLHPNYWGQGLGRECAAAVIGWAFAVGGLDAVVAAAVVDNPSSRRVLSRLGMVERLTVPYTSAVSGDSAVFIVHRQQLQSGTLRGSRARAQHAVRPQEDKPSPLPRGSAVGQTGDDPVSAVGPHPTTTGPAVHVAPSSAAGASTRRPRGL